MTYVRRPLPLILLIAALSPCAALAIAQVEGGLLFVSSTDNVIATYRGTTGSYQSDLYLFSPANDLGILLQNQVTPANTPIDLGSFPIGTELVFRMHVNNTGDDFYSGPAAQNGDSHTHARATYNWSQTETLVEFEDLFNGGFDYNDLSVSLTNVTAPEPTALLPLGLLALAALRRR